MKKNHKLSVSFVLLLVSISLLTACSKQSETSKSEEASSSMIDIGISKKDYGDALDQVNKLKKISQSNKQATGTISFPKTLEDLQTEAKKQTDWQTSVEKEVSLLEKSTAYKGDKEIQKKFLELQMIFNKLKPGLINLQEFYSKVLPAYNIGKLGGEKTVEEMTKFIDQSIIQLGEVKVTDSVFQQKITEMIGKLREFKTPLKGGKEQEIQAGFKKLYAESLDLAKYVQKSTENLTYNFSGKLDELIIYLNAKIK